MKLFKIIGSLAIVAALAVGCASESTNSTPTPTNEMQGSFPKAPSTPTTQPKSPLTLAGEQISRQYPWISVADGATLAQLACLVIDEAGSVLNASYLIVTDPAFYGMEEEMGFIFGTAIRYLCPQYISELNRLV